MKNSEYKDCGCANGWYSPNIMVNGKWVKEHPDRIPSEVLACNAAGHQKRGVSLGRCWSQVYCDICKITYDVDSSD